MENKTNIALIGPIYCNSGIATVINAIISSKRIKNNYEVIIFHTSNYKDSNILINLSIFVKSIILFLKELLESKINLVHIHTSSGRSFYRKIFFIFLSSLFKQKTILHIHASRFYDFFIDSEGLKKKIIEFFLKKPDITVLLCNDWKEKIERKFALKNTVVINNPIPLDLEQIKASIELSNANFIKILFLGFLIKTKGIYDLIEIADRLNKNSFAHKIIVCGKGDEEKMFLKKIKDKNLINVEYLGWISGKKKIDLIKSSDIFLLPSYKEGMPMAILEAMAFGLPIISTKIAAIPELVINNKNGYLLNPGDISGFVKKIKILILDPKKRKLFGEKSKMIAKRFEKEKISEEWNRLYKKILDRD